MYLCNLGGPFRLFWLPAERRLIARSVVAQHVHKVPEGGLLIGLYQHGIGASDVLGDLVDVLAHPPDPAPAPEPEPAIAQPKPIPETHWTWAPRRFNVPDAPKK